MSRQILPYQKKHPLTAFPNTPTDEVWSAVNAYFSDKPAGTKLKCTKFSESNITYEVKNNEGLSQKIVFSHSFVRVKSSIYAISAIDGRYLSPYNEHETEYSSITKETWRCAVRYFSQNARETKITHQQKQWSLLGDSTNELHFSFVKFPEPVGIAALEGPGHVMAFGSFGKIKKAITQNGQYFAIKIPAKHLISDSKYRALIENECTLGEHAGFVLTHCKKMLQPPIFQQLFVSHLYSEDLFDYLDRLYHQDKYDNGYTEILNILTILYRLATDIDQLHSLGILHRDIKPENTLLTKNLAVKLCDYGFAVKVSNPDDLLSFKSSTLVGTRLYKAPEITEQKHYSKQSEIYAFGKCATTAYSVIKKILKQSTQGKQLCDQIEQLNWLTTQSDIISRPQIPFIQCYLAYCICCFKQTSSFDDFNDQLNQLGSCCMQSESVRRIIFALLTCEPNAPTFRNNAFTFDLLKLLISVQQKNLADNQINQLIVDIVFRRWPLPDLSVFDDERKEILSFILEQYKTVARTNNSTTINPYAFMTVSHRSMNRSPLIELVHDYFSPENPDIYDLEKLKTLKETILKLPQPASASPKSETKEVLPFSPISVNSI